MVSANMRAIVESDGAERQADVVELFTRGFQVIEYPHIRRQHIYEAAIVGQTGQRVAGCLPTEVILQLSLPGDVFGEVSIILGESPIADIVATRSLRCLVLAGPRVEPFLISHPRVMYRMLQAQARRLRAANRWRS